MDPDREAEFRATAERWAHPNLLMVAAISGALAFALLGRWTGIPFWIQLAASVPYAVLVAGTAFAVRLARDRLRIVNDATAGYKLPPTAWIGIVCVRVLGPVHRWVAFGRRGQIASGWGLRDRYGRPLPRRATKAGKEQE